MRELGGLGMEVGGGGGRRGMGEGMKLRGGDYKNLY